MVFRRWVPEKIPEGNGGKGGRKNPEIPVFSGFYPIVHGLFVDNSRRVWYTIDDFGTNNK